MKFRKVVKLSLREREAEGKGQSVEKDKRGGKGVADTNMFNYSLSF